MMVASSAVTVILSGQVTKTNSIKPVTGMARGSFILGG
jgi:hypothetical protein